MAVSETDMMTWQAEEHEREIDGLQRELEGLASKYHSLIQDFQGLADALDCAPSSMDVLARVAGLVQLERDVQNLADEIKQDRQLDGCDGGQFADGACDHLIGLADARPRSKYSHVARAGR